MAQKVLKVQQQQTDGKTVLRLEALSLEHILLPRLNKSTQNLCCSKSFRERDDYNNNRTLLLLINWPKYGKKPYLAMLRNLF